LLLAGRINSLFGGKLLSGWLVCGAGSRHRKGRSTSERGISMQVISTPIPSDADGPSVMRSVPAAKPVPFILPLSLRLFCSLQKPVRSLPVTRIVVQENCSRRGPALYTPNYTHRPPPVVASHSIAPMSELFHSHRSCAPSSVFTSFILFDSSA